MRCAAYETQQRATTGSNDDTAEILRTACGVRRAAYETPFSLHKTHPRGMAWKSTKTRETTVEILRTVCCVRRAAHETPFSTHETHPREFAGLEVKTNTTTVETMRAAAGARVALHETYPREAVWAESIMQGA